MRIQPFGKNIKPKCEYCASGKRTRDGNKILCERKGLVELDYKCTKYTYCPFKRIPVKQLNKEVFEDDSIE